VNNTLVQQEANLTALLRTLTQSDQDLNTFLRQNQGNIIGLSAHGLATLKTLARYSREFPCVLRELDRFEPDINRVLGAGTSQPGLHVHVNVLEPLGTAQAPLGNYLPGKDTPFYGDDLGPHCYPIPFRGIPLNDGASPATARSSSARTSAAGRIPAAASSTTALDSSLPGGSLPGGLSLANSPQENEFVNEISAPALRVPPGSLPGWSSMLVGPLYRGRQVQLR
jgi:phospholipid/cholesterol/gamma-HCH transport system substrate-binding protein